MAATNMKKQLPSSRSAARAQTKKREFDRLADSGVDMTPYVDWSKSRRPGLEVQRVNVDFPVDLLRAIDQEARRIGVTRQAFIKLRLADTLAGR